MNVATTGYVAPIFVPITNEMIVATVADRYEGIMGGECPANALAALSAQVRLECRDRAPCGNPAGLRGVSPDGHWTTFTTHEMIDGVLVSVPPDKSTNRFRAYMANGRPSFALGVDDYLMLLCRGKFAPAIERAAAGDFAGFVHELRLRGYFTATELNYAHGVLSVEAVLARLPILAAYFKDQHT